MLNKCEHKECMPITDKGFTLIELIVVMAIVAILVLLAAPRFLGYTKDAKVTAMKQDTKVLSDAVEMYHVHNNVWPIVEGVSPVNPGIGGVISLHEIDMDKVEVSNIQPDQRYGVVTKGANIGDVFSIDGVYDRFGMVHYGSNLKLFDEENFKYDTYESEPIYTSEEIDNLVNNEGYKRVISSEDLINISNNLKGKYIMTNDIDLSGLDFEPIGLGVNEKGEPLEFEGVFDGGGFTINNLHINKPDTDVVGLFSRVGLRGTVNNVILMNANVTGQVRTGLLAGKSFGNIDNIRVHGSVTGTSMVGGAIGRNNRNSLSNSSASVEVIGYDRVGGLVGQNSGNGKIYTSYANSNVKGNLNTGGLTGWNGTGHIHNSYSRGLVQGVHSVGGLSGKFTRGTIENSYTLSHVHGEVKVGLLIGRFRDDISIDRVFDSYYLDQKNNKFDQLHFKGLTSEEMSNTSSYPGWDFESIWELTNNEYPVLQWQNN